MKFSVSVFTLSELEISSTVYLNKNVIIFIRLNVILYIAVSYVLVR